MISKGAMAVSAALKARLQRLYLDAANPYAALVAESGLTRFEFQSLVKIENWGKRTKAAKVLKAAKAVPEGAAASNDNVADLGREDDVAQPKIKLRAPKSGSKRKTLKRKLTPSPTGLLKLVYGTIEKELGKLERQSGDKSQDRERASRALSQIMNSLEKAVEMQRGIAKDNTRGGDKKDKEALRNAEDLRKEIVERIERFRASRAVGQ